MRAWGWGAGRSRGQSQSVEGTLGGTVPRVRGAKALLGKSQVGSVGEREAGKGRGPMVRRARPHSQAWKA